MRRADKLKKLPQEITIKSWKTSRFISSFLWQVIRTATIHNVCRLRVLYVLYTPPRRSVTIDEFMALNLLNEFIRPDTTQTKYAVYKRTGLFICVCCMYQPNTWTCFSWIQTKLSSSTIFNKWCWKTQMGLFLEEKKNKNRGSCITLNT